MIKTSFKLLSVLILAASNTNTQEKTKLASDPPYGDNEKVGKYIVESLSF